MLAQQNIDKMIMNTSKNDPFISKDKNKLSLPDIEYLSYNSVLLSANLIILHGKQAQTRNFLYIK